MSKPKTIKIDDVLYVQQGTEVITGPVSILRGEKFGAFMAEIVDDSQAPTKVVVENARRLWYWEGAASLSQLAIDGVSKPKSCKFPAAVPLATLFNVCEIIPCTQAAVDSVNSVPVWKA